MAEKSPPSLSADEPLEELDAQWYRDTYPDVALSGLSPETHYRLFGRAMGRPGAADQDQRPAPLPASAGQSLSLRAVADCFGQARSPGSNRGHALNQADSPLVTRPDDLLPSAQDHRRDAADHLADAVRLEIWSEDGSIALGRFESVTDARCAAGPLLLYARLLDLPAGALSVQEPDGTKHPLSVPGAGEALPGCAMAGIKRGPARLENGWYSDETTLRFALAGWQAPTEDETGPALLRFWQAPARASANLAPIGGFTLPEAGPGFFDMSLADPLMPVLIELIDRQGHTQGLTLLAFPSLLRGGLHAAERAAHQMGLHPLDEIWRLTDALLAELLDGPHDAGFAIGHLEVDLRRATGAERIFAEPLRDWLHALFGLAPAPASNTPAGADGAGQHYLETLLGEAAPRDAAALTLVLPPDAIPTLSALVSRRLRLPEHCKAATGPYLVADMISSRPLWSVAMPVLEQLVDNETPPCVPILRRVFDTPDAPDRPTTPAPDWLVPLHLALLAPVRLPSNDLIRLAPMVRESTPTQTKGAPPEPLTVVLSATDPALCARALTALVRQEGITLEGVLICPQGQLRQAQADEIRTSLGGIWDGPVWMLPTGTRQEVDLDKVTELAQSDMILMLDEEVILQDTQILKSLSRLLQADDTAASVGGMLLHEGTLKDGSTVVVAASGGLFPEAVSFLTAPRLAVIEPDITTALPDTVYPVIANSFALCLVRRAALLAARAGRPDVSGPTDLWFGLASHAAGWRNLATTQTRAGTTRPLTRRDQIDPFGLSCLAPATWDSLLSSVTVLRELRG